MRDIQLEAINERGDGRGWHIFCLFLGLDLYKVLMMKGETTFWKVWAGLDRLLLGAVFILLGVVWYATERAEAKSRPDEGRANVILPREVQDERRVTPRAKTVDGLRVSARSPKRMTSIARSMVEAGWEKLPCSPAMDMREDGKVYVIRFALPEGVAHESVRVTTAGSMLTMAMKPQGGGQTYLRRVRLPCSVDREDHVASVVSNNVLCIRIQPGG